MGLIIKEKKELTLQSIKDCIAFDKTDLLYTSLSGMCDCWYGIEKQKGLDEKQALSVVLNNLSKEMLKFSC
jgi:hypothetical protein